MRDEGLQFSIDLIYQKSLKPKTLIPHLSSVHGQRSTVNGLRSTVNGQRFTVNPDLRQGKLVNYKPTGTTIPFLFLLISSGIPSRVSFFNISIKVFFMKSR